LTPAAWVIVLTALATYSGLWASYLLARPALRGFALQSNVLLLETEKSTDSRIEEFRELAIKSFKDRLKQNIPRDRRSNKWGVALLILSFALFSGAVALQLHTDPAFQTRQEVHDRVTGSPTATRP
jgi:hypothetical protein